MPSRRSVGLTFVRCHCIFIFPSSSQKSTWSRRRRHYRRCCRPLVAASTTTTPTTVGHAPTTTTLPPLPLLLLLLPVPPLVSRWFMIKRQTKLFVRPSVRLEETRIQFLTLRRLTPSPDPRWRWRRTWSCLRGALSDWHALATQMSLIRPCDVRQEEGREGGRSSARTPPRRALLVFSRVLAPANPEEEGTKWDRSLLGDRK